MDMDIAHDFIAAVHGPDWKYGLSRILVDSEGRGVVFIAGSEEPFASFVATSVSTSRGVGELAGGDQVSWRRRGSSCQYKLAKCKVSTDTMKSWWEASLAEPAVEEVLAEETPAEKPKRTRRTRAQIEADAAEADLDVL